MSTTSSNDRSTTKALRLERLGPRPVLTLRSADAGDCNVMTVGPDGLSFMVRHDVDLELAARQAQALVELPDALRVVRGWRRGRFVVLARSWGFAADDVQLSLLHALSTGGEIELERDDETGRKVIRVGGLVVAEVPAS